MSSICKSEVCKVRLALLHPQFSRQRSTGKVDTGHEVLSHAGGTTIVGILSDGQDSER